jgi:hypothetical protein
MSEGFRKVFQNTCTKSDANERIKLIIEKYKLILCKNRIMDMEIHIVRE